MKNLFMLMIIVSLFIMYCGDDDDGNPTGPSAGSNVVDILEDIESNTTWFGDSVYVIRTYDFYVSAVLTIEPGTVVKFTDEGPYLVLGDGGVIRADATSGDPIVFTSIHDDEHGGDSNQNGDATQPRVRDWGHIDTNAKTGSIFDQCEFYYGGGTGTSATLSLSDGSQATVTRCTFAHNSGTRGSTWASVLDASTADAGTVIRNNVFYDNDWPLTIGTAFSLDHSNRFHDPDNPSVTNTHNAVFVYSTDHITRDISWRETEVAFVIDDADFWINRGASLTLADQVVLKFYPGSVLLLQSGASALVNHDGAGVAFTSLKDDSRKGDTNGDGNASTANDNDWVGIYDDSGNTEYPYYFSWDNIYYDSY